MPTLKIALTQQPAVNAAIDHNRDLLAEQFAKATAEGADLVVTGANPLTGDAGDLLVEPAFGQHARAAATDITGTNTLAAIDDRALLSGARTTLLSRNVNGVHTATVVVTDPATLGDSIEEAAKTRADLIIVSAAIPFRLGRPNTRRDMLIGAATYHTTPIVFVNRVGGSDRRVYDGGSMVVAADGTVLYQAPLFSPATTFLDLDPTHSIGAEVTEVAEWPVEDDAQVWAALVTGTRDYVHDNGFTEVVLGLSGGIDSAVVAAITVDALGAEHVHGIGMPGPYSSEGSVTDARALAEGLGMRFDLASIKDTYHAEVAALGDLLDGPGAQVAKENIQARLRALHLFTVANARNALVLNTCQKSEDAVGYATYGGDALGSYAPMVDLLKRDVYRLAKWRNTQGDVPVIPTDSITKPPSAELSPGQQDTDTLPPYEILDPIIEHYLVRRGTPRDIANEVMAQFGYTDEQATETVGWVLKMIDRTEWKRQQGPLGPQISRAPFDSRDVPVTNGRVHRFE